MRSTTSSDTAWFRDYRVLFDHWDEFYPAASMTRTRCLNALTRFVVYATAVVSWMRRNTDGVQFAFVLVVLIGLTYPPSPSPSPAASASSPSRRASSSSFPDRPYPPHAEPFRSDTLSATTPKNTDDDEHSSACIAPTPTNPFMNRAIGDTSFPNVPACEANHENADAMWRLGLFQNVDDVYDRHLTSRQFYTVPDSRLPNDQTHFAHMLYGDGVRRRTRGTCKEQTSQCADHAYF